MRSSPTVQILGERCAANKPGDLHTRGGASTTCITQGCALGERGSVAYVDSVRFKALALALAVAALGLSACAGDGASEGVAVRTKEMKFLPTTIRLASGAQTFVVRNVGELRHTFSINSIGEEVTVEPGRTRTLSVTLEPGTYRYVCRILDHEGLGMRGTLRVSAT